MDLQPAIECRKLCRTYGSVQALQPLDLAVAAGSVFGFLGRNGAGKSTTMRLLTGLATPTSGEAWVGGVRIEHGDSAGREKFGFLPEEPAFHDWMTPRQLLTYVAQLFLMPEAALRPRVDAMLQQVGLAAEADRRIKGFSRGMRQRLGLAQALVHSPPVLFLDEPTSALDPGGRKEVLDLIEALRGRVTIFLSSHILGDLERVCDAVGILHQGRLLKTSSRDDLLAQHGADTLVLESEGEALPEALLAEVRTLPWVRSLDLAKGAHLIRIKVSDAERARQEVLPLLARHRARLRRYEWLRPSLEDIFLEMSQ